MDNINVNVNEIIDNLVDKREDLMSMLFNSTIFYDNYNISIFAKWLHSLPHIDIRFNYLKNTTFNPNDNQYLESLGILVAIPGFWLILTLLFFLIFFLCRCCDANNKKKRTLTLCKGCLFMFAVLSSLIIMVGMFGSLVAHQGLLEVQNKTEDMGSVVESIKRQTSTISSSFKNNFEPNLDQLKLLFDSSLVSDLSMKTTLIKNVMNFKRNLSIAERQLDEISTRLEKVDINSIPEHLNAVETIRWPTTFAVLGTLTFICLILIWGILKHSRCILILFSVLGLLSLVVCWVITSVYLGISVAGSDFCLDPQPFISEQFNSVIDEQIFDYYVSCNIKSPFEQNIQETNVKMEWIKRLNNELSQACKNKCNTRDITDKLHLLSNELNQVKKEWDLLQSLLECQRFHNDYILIMTATCKEVLEGVVLMLLSSTAAGLCFTVLVLCASHTWINIRKKRPLMAEQTEETDPFLPPPSSSSTASSANSKRIRDSYGSAGSGRPRYFMPNDHDIEVLVINSS